MVTRLLVCSDDRLFGAALKALLNEQSDFEVLAESGLSGSVAGTVRRMGPDVVLVAVDQKGIGGLKAFAGLSRVVALTDGSASHVAQALVSGARAVLSGRSSGPELFTTIRLIARSAVVVAPISAAEFVRSPTVSPSPRARSLLTALTDRERDVLRLIAYGMSNNEIAHKLSISTATVRSHVHHLLRKFGVRGRAHAVAVAYQTGLVDMLDQDAARSGSASHEAR